MTGTREYILFTRGPPVNDLFPGDPQLRYGDPGVPFHPNPRRSTVSFTAGRIANTRSGGRTPATARHRLPIGALEWYTPRQLNRQLNRIKRTLSLSVSRLRRATKGTSPGRVSLHSASAKHRARVRPATGPRPARSWLLHRLRGASSLCGTEPEAAFLRLPAAAMTLPKFDMSRHEARRAPQKVPKLGRTY